jgi:hypothetical protein
MKLTRLTLNEVLSISISVVALLIAVITPFISYRWLQNSVREQRLKADGFKAAGSYTTSYNADDPKASYITYRFYISNDGPLSVGKVAISIYNGGKLFPENVAGDFKVFPPNRVSVTPLRDTIFIGLDEPLPPGQKLEITWTRPYDRTDDKKPIQHPFIWVSSEATPSIQLSLQFEGGGAFANL